MIFAVIAFTWLLALVVLLGACRAAATGDLVRTMRDDASSRAPRPQASVRARSARPRSRALQASSR